MVRGNRSHTPRGPKLDVLLLQKLVFFRKSLMAQPQLQNLTCLVVNLPLLL